MCIPHPWRSGSSWELTSEEETWGGWGRAQHICPSWHGWLPGILSSGWPLLLSLTSWPPVRLVREGE